ncbi:MULTISPECIES: hypothetical protein [Streptomyces]|uniref:Uncharacterized protein n=2 Tax=Streptomyces TaxID=1883 RepID=A0A939JQW4_9ACTN|nr:MULTISPECIES: hypothetical protein [Streptomyces]MBO0654147.1 hypothetical protein [Streptomyces triculaminicus]QSY48825.1 hypothetical protein J3S04_27990 [Streptomyces griseocarneus]
MERANSKHGAKRDDELKREVAELMRSGRPTHTQEWQDAESPAADETPEGMTAPRQGSTRR